MRKEYTEAQKKEWLRLFDEGKTPRWIAREKAHCDPRTVEKAIKDLQRKEEVKVARVELVKDALKKHQRELFEELDSLTVGAFSLPDRELAPLSWHRGKDSVFEALKGKHIEEPETDRKHTASALPRRQLLREHLKNSRLFTLVAQRDKACNIYTEARRELQRSIILLLQKGNRYRVTDRSEGMPYICSYTAGDSLYREVLHRAFHTGYDSDFEKQITADSSNGSVNYGKGLIFAECPGEELEFRNHILDVLRRAEQLPVVANIVASFKDLEEKNRKATDKTEEIRLLGIITGDCKVCKQLGM